MEEKEWFLYVVDHHEGPFSISEIQKLIKKGEAKTTSYVWKEGYEDWVMMTDVSEFGYAGPKSDSHGTPAFVTGDGSTKSGPIVPAQDIGSVRSSDSVWCLNSKKSFSGPHSMKTIVRKVNAGEASINDSVWMEGWTGFVPISNIPEFMADVKAAVKDPSGTFEVKAGKGAAALGLAGGPSTRVYKWYRSRKFFLAFILLLIVSVYQGLSTGFFNPVLTTIGLKDKVAKLELAPFPVDKAFDLIEVVKRSAIPVFEKALVFLPENMQNWLSTIEIPEGISPNDAETIRLVARTSIKDGARVVSALPAGDEFNPSFVLGSNMPDGTSFTVVLKGVEGTLLNAFSYERTAYVDITRSIGRTPRFGYEGNKPLPKGQYILVVYESAQQIPQVASVLSTLPKRPAQSHIPPEKVVFVKDMYFLGGRRDATYDSKLKEFNEKVKTRIAQETTEIKQILGTLESMANESATKFFSLANLPANAKRKAEWNRYHAKYAQLSGQLRQTLNRISSEMSKTEYLLPQHYRKLLQTYELTERLHEVETAYIDKGGTMEVVKAQAGQTSAALNELKQAISKVAQ